MTVVPANPLAKPRVSVVVPVRNGLPWLEEQLAALVAQDLDQPWEVVVADNGSTDGSRSVVERAGEQGHRFRSIDASAVRGPAAARNAGASAAQGELLVFCDADDVVQPGWLSAHVEALENCDVTAGVFDSWTLNGTKKPSPLVYASPPAKRQFGFLEAGLSSNLAVRRKAFEKIGGFAEDLTVGEDTDLCWRLQLAGYRFAVIERAVVSRRDRSGFKQVLRRYIAYGRCGPALYRRFRGSGLKSEGQLAAKSWIWIFVSLPGLVDPTRRIKWAEVAGWRIGRLFGSFKDRVFFP